jgi:hypothetical protein
MDRRYIDCRFRQTQKVVVAHCNCKAYEIFGRLVKEMMEVGEREEDRDDEKGRRLESRKAMDRRRRFDLSTTCSLSHRD